MMWIIIIIYHKNPRGQLVFLIILIYNNCLYVHKQKLSLIFNN